MSATTEKSLEDQESLSNRTEGTESTAGVSCCEEVMAPGAKPMDMCPMAGMCMGMMKPGAWSGWLLFLPAVFLVAGGLLVILVPEALVWLLGGTAIVMGVMLFFMVARMRKFMAGSSGRTTGPTTGTDAMRRRMGHANSPGAPGRFC